MANNATKYTPLITQVNSTDDENNILNCQNCQKILQSTGYWYCKVCTKEYCSLCCFEISNFKLNHICCMKHYFTPR